MTGLLSSYYAWATPNILPALAAAAATSWWIAWRRGSGSWPHPRHLFWPVGFATAAVVVLALGAALTGVEPGFSSGIVGLAAGIAAAIAARPEPA